jgi:hypothetical protein
MKAHFLLDNNVPHLKNRFPKGRAKTTVDLGLAPEDPDYKVINLAQEKARILVTADQGIVTQAKKYQYRKKHGFGCLRGLLVLPNDKAVQQRVLKELLRQERPFKHPKFPNGVKWDNVQEMNLLVRATATGETTVEYLCSCYEKD